MVYKIFKRILLFNQEYTGVFKVTKIANFFLEKFVFSYLKMRLDDLVIHDLRRYIYDLVRLGPQLLS